MDSNPPKKQLNGKLDNTKESAANTMWRRFGVNLAVAGFIALLYYLGSRLGRALVAKPENVAAIWPPSGLMLGSLLVIGFRRWKIVIPIVFMAIVLVNLAVGNALLLSLTFATANCAESMVASGFLLWVLKGPPKLDQLRDVWAFVGCAVIAANAVTALAAAQLIRLCTGGAFWDIWRLWWVEDGVGMLVVAPIVLSIVSFIPLEWSRKRSIEALALLGMLVAASFWIFDATNLSSNQVFRFPYLLLPLTVLLAIRGGSAGAACGAFSVAAATIWGVLRGTGMFGEWGPDIKEDSMIAAQIFIAAISMTGLIVSALYDERQRAIKGLQANLREKTVLLDMAPVGIMKLVDRRMVWINSKMEEICQYSKQELENQTTRMFYPTQEAFEWLNREALLVLEQGKTYETTQEFFRKDGAGLFIRCIGKAIDPSNTSGGVLWVYEDVTEKRQAEKTLHKERHLLQTIIDNAKNSHLAYLDRDFNFFCVNNAYASTMGNRPEEMIGLNLFEFYPNEKNKAICSQVRDMGEPIEAVDMPFEFPGQVNRGTTYWDWTLAPVKDSAGQVEGLVLSLFETTARKRAEQEMARLLEQTEKDAAIKGQLLREINHRVINNLIALRGLLLVEKRGTPKEGRLWTNIALDRVSDRVQGMLAAHELLSNFEWAPMPVADLARKIIGQIFKTCSAEERVFIEVSNARSMVSPRQVNSLALILNELATNTIKYGTTKRRRTNISVQTEEDGDFLILRYRDDGPGYPEQILAGERANVGLALINDLAEGSLGGNLTISNDKGSVAEIRIRKEPLSHT